MDLNRIINSHREKWVRSSMKYRSLSYWSTVMTLVVKILRQTGTKSPLKWHNQPGKKNKGLLESLTSDMASKQQHKTRWNGDKWYEDGFNTDRDMVYCSKRQLMTLFEIKTRKRGTYCGIELFFKRYFGNFDFNVRYCGIIPLQYAVFHHFWLTVFGNRRSFTVLQYCSFGLSCLM